MVVGRILVTLRLIQETVDKLMSDVKQDWSFIFLVYLLKVLFKNRFLQAVFTITGVLRLIQETVDKLLSDVKLDQSFIFLVYFI